MWRDLWLVTLGVALGWVLFAPSTIEVQAGAAFDEHKWQRLEEHRAFRRANEARYESCVRSCAAQCR